MFTLSLFLTLVSFTTSVKGHVSIWHPSMYGFNVTQQTFPYDNRPVAPLTDYTFEQWWFHGHLDHPPNPGDIFELPAGQTATTELGCNKGATSYFASSEGGDIRQGNAVCPNSPLSAIHTTGFQDLTGCALAIAYKSDAKQVQPEDFTVFSVNQTCVWTRFTDFQVPAKMPPCPEGGCTCAWFWIHSPDSGGEQNYMNGFKCNVTGSASNVALATPQLPRRCGIDLANERSVATLGNCTYGAKQPFYWFQKERNNMLEGTYSPPFYTDLYNFRDGAQNDIFVDSYSSIPIPSVNQTVIPMLPPIPSDTPVLSIPVPSLVSPLLYSETSSSGMSSSAMTPAPSVPASSVSSSCSTPTVNSQSPSPPGVQPSSMQSVVSSSSSMSPGVTVTTTVMVTVFANEPSSVPSSSVSNSVGSLPSPVQNDTTSVSIIELVAEPSSTSTSTSCKARNGTALRRRSTFASRLLRHRKQKRNYSLWHIF